MDPAVHQLASQLKDVEGPDAIDNSVLAAEGGAEHGARRFACRTPITDARIKHAGLAGG
jgi:hypothetical protein